MPDYIEKYQSDTDNILKFKAGILKAMAKKIIDNMSDDDINELFTISEEERKEINQTALRMYIKVL